MWSSTEEAGFPFTVRKLHGCLKTTRTRSQVLHMSGPVLEAETTVTGELPSRHFRAMSSGLPFSRTGAFLGKHWASYPLGSPGGPSIMQCELLNSAPSWPSTRQESQQTSPHNCLHPAGAMRADSEREGLFLSGTTALEASSRKMPEAQVTDCPGNPQGALAGKRGAKVKKRVGDSGQLHSRLPSTGACTATEQESLLTGLSGPQCLRQPLSSHEISIDFGPQ